MAAGGLSLLRLALFGLALLALTPSAYAKECADQDVAESGDDGRANAPFVGKEEQGSEARGAKAREHARKTAPLPHEDLDLGVDDFIDSPLFALLPGNGHRTDRINDPGNLVIVLDVERVGQGPSALANGPLEAHVADVSPRLPSGGDALLAHGSRHRKSATILSRQFRHRLFALAGVVVIHCATQSTSCATPAGSGRVDVGDDDRWRREVATENLFAERAERCPRLVVEVCVRRHSPPEPFEKRSAHVASLAGSSHTPRNLGFTVAFAPSQHNPTAQKKIRGGAIYSLAAETPTGKPVSHALGERARSARTKWARRTGGTPVALAEEATGVAVVSGTAAMPGRCSIHRSHHAAGFDS